MREAPFVMRLGQIMIDNPTLYWTLYRRYPMLQDALKKFIPPEFGSNNRVFSFRGIDVPIHITDMPTDHSKLRDDLREYVTALLWCPVDPNELPQNELTYIVMCMFCLVVTCSPGSRTLRCDDPGWWRGEAFRLCVGILAEAFGLPPPAPRGLLWGNQIRDVERARRTGW